MVKQTDYNSIPWDDYFYASTESKSGVKWKVERRSGAKYQMVNAAIGSDAGTIQYRKSGKTMGWKIVLDGVTYLAHRILYVLLHGSIDCDKVIDHLNGVNTDNTPANLVLKDWKGNAQNKGLHHNSKSGVAGVTQDSRGNWRARWATGIGKGQGGKMFSVAKYGHDQAFALAVAYRAEQIQLLNAAGASYTERHCGLTPATPPAEPPVTPSVQPT